jgi:XTP/dITP diphosphohydrolase
VSKEPTEVVLASHNAGKLAEMQALLAPLGWHLRPLSEFSAEGAEETASSFIENALLKARFAAQISGLPALADDSGIEAMALDGAPGVRSARYAGEHGDDAANNRALLAALAARPEASRAARFVCAMAFLRHAEDPVPVIAQGLWMGEILPAPRGEGGFGYDPLFLVPDLNRSAAELPAAEKNRISHRGRAVRALLRQLQGHGDDGG